MNDETAKRGEYGARSRRVSAMTNLVHSGSPSAKAAGLLNPPVHRASTITYDSVEAYTGRHSRIYDDVIYGLYGRSEEHTSELQSLMRISYAVFCLKKKKIKIHKKNRAKKLRRKSQIKLQQTRSKSSTQQTI